MAVTAEGAASCLDVIGALLLGILGHIRAAVTKRATRIAGVIHGPVCPCHSIGMALVARSACGQGDVRRADIGLGIDSGISTAVTRGAGGSCFRGVIHRRGSESGETPVAGIALCGRWNMGSRHRKPRTGSLVTGVAYAKRGRWGGRLMIEYSSRPGQRTGPGGMAAIALSATRGDMRAAHYLSILGKVLPRMTSTAIVADSE